MCTTLTPRGVPPSCPLWVIPSFLLPIGYFRFTVGGEYARHTTVYILLGVEHTAAYTRLIPSYSHIVENLAPTKLFLALISER